MGVPVLTAKGRNWISIFSWREVWEHSLSFPCLSSVWGLCTGMMEQKPGHSMGQNAKFQDWHRECLPCVLPTLLWSQPLCVAQPPVLHSSDCGKAFLGNLDHSREEPALAWFHFFKVNLRGGSYTSSCNIIAAAFLLSRVDMAEKRQQCYNCVKLHLKPSLSEVLKVLCCNKTTTKIVHYILPFSLAQWAAQCYSWNSQKYCFI